jgi:hypothetical protein
MPIQLNPFKGAHLNCHLIKVLGESFDFGGLEETDKFQVVTHESRGMFWEAGDHTFSDIVRIAGSLYVPEDGSSLGRFLVAHWIVDLRLIGARNGLIGQVINFKLQILIVCAVY